MKWSADDQRRFADRDILRAVTVPGKARPSPEVSEWPLERRRTVSLVITLDVDSDGLDDVLGTSEAILEWFKAVGSTQANRLQEMVNDLTVDARVLDVHPILGRKWRMND